MQRNYSGGAQEKRKWEDGKELVKHERRRCECFNCGKKGHLARDYQSPRRHLEGNVATTKEVILSGCISKEEWDAKEATTLKATGLILWKT